MLKLERIGIKNFLSVGNVFSRTELSKHSNTLISGKNGSGKSTLIDALCFALYGKAFRNVNKPTLVNMVNKKDCVVELEFTVGKSQYKIVRGIKPAIFEIYRDDVLINQHAAAKDYQEYLEKDIIQMSYSTFCQIVVLGAANWKAFLSLTTTERRKVLEDMLNIEIFSVMQTILKGRQDLTKEELTNINRDIEAINNSIDMQDKHRADLAKRSEDFITTKRNTIAAFEADVADLVVNRDKLKAKIGRRNKKHEGIHALQDMYDSVKDKGTKIDAMMDGVKRHIKFYENEAACPTCKQEMDQEFSVSMLEKDRETLAKQVAAKAKIEAKLQQLRDELDAYHVMSEEIIKLQSEYTDICMNIHSLEQGVIQCHKDIEDAQSDVLEPDGHDYQKDLKDALAAKTAVLAKSDVEREAHALLKDDGIKSQIIRQYVPIINTLVNRYLERMEFFVKFHLNEKFEMEIRALHKEDMSYESFSQGEKMRIDLAILFTWRDIIRQRKESYCNLLIFDEIMDSSLDEQGTDDFLEIVRHLTPENNVFIISHKINQSSDKFDNLIEIEKKKNFSRVRKT